MDSAKEGTDGRVSERGRKRKDRRTERRQTDLECNKERAKGIDPWDNIRVSERRRQTRLRLFYFQLTYEWHESLLLVSGELLPPGAEF